MNVRRELARMTIGGGPAIETVDVEGIRESLADRPIIFAVLFGSHARGNADHGSDVDITLRFPETMDAHERFRLRNRIDADLQSYAEGFVDVSDVEALPLPVAHAALTEGVRLVGDDGALSDYRERIGEAYEESEAERREERRAFIDRLAEGDT
jgi:predicted nucleotidyltransferase